MKFRTIVLLSALAASALSACAPIVVGGAMLGGTLMATDRRTSGAQVEDQAIELKSSAIAATSAPRATTASC